jgi:hypothetical protein
MFILFCILAIAQGLSVEDFVQDVTFSILGTIIDGVEASRRTGNSNYDLVLRWQDSLSNSLDCNYCHYNIEDKEVVRKYTDDARKLDYTNDPFVFPTEDNTNIPHYDLNKEEILVYLWKELTDLFSGVDVQLKSDSCCYVYSLSW